jgi:tetratricopeptide (TPR) repeat protein
VIPRPRTASLLLFVLVLLAYSQILGGSFQYDDFNVIVADSSVHSLGAWAAGLGGLRPLLKLTYALNWRLDQAPAGFLVVNFILHLLNTWLVHWLLRWVGNRGGLGSRQAAIAAFGGALLFALHPLQVEAVAYASGRSSSLAAALVLASVVAYLHGRDRLQWLWTDLISPGFFLLALATKETALALPLALTLLECCGPDGWRRPVRGPRVHWLLAATGAAALVLHPGYRKLLAFSFDLRGPGDQLRCALEGLGYLFGKLLWPSGLNIDPPLAMPGSWSLPLAGTALGVVGLLSAGLWALRRQPWLAFGLLWGLVFLLPTQGPVPRLDLANDRHLYLSLAGFAFVFAALLSFWPERSGISALAATSLALGLVTVAGVRDYRDEATLWRSSLNVAPQNPRAWNNLGVALHECGEFKSAALAFQEALRLRPGYRLARTNLESMEHASPRR